MGAAVARVATAQAAVATVTVAPVADLLAKGTVRSGREVGAGSGALPDGDLLPVLRALRDLLPHGALQRGSVVAASNWNLLCAALAAGPVASGAWCVVAGIPEFGVRRRPMPAWIPPDCW